ncbi:MAG: HEPN domain-containing protein [Chloroflexi bacterium]|nr:HEPN domain-containing protein [Chloroflexota bacterium]
MNARVRKIIAALKRYDPERVILFGSTARGDADRYSDIDIVVIKDTPKRFLDRLGDVYDLIQPDFALDALVYTPKEFTEMRARRNPFVEQVLRDGQVVYERARGNVHQRVLPPQGGPGMKKVEAEQEGRRWLEQAQSDLAVAKWNEEGKFHSAACFWSQQTAERALKAFLYYSGKRRVVGHSVLELAKACGRLDKDFKPLVNRVAPLDRYYIPTRYPNGLPGGVPAQVYQADDARDALNLAEETVIMVANKIPPAPPAEQDE